jgi:DNA-binding transcriptional regulator YdaS (Cro superfamily)
MDDAVAPYEALMLAVEMAGSQSELARICDVGQPTVWKWLQSSKRLPAEHVLAVEAATGISRHLLRPDIYPADLGPSPAWRGVDNGAQRVAFNQSNGLQRGHAA